MRKKILSIVTTLSLILTAPLAQAASSSFTDVPSPTYDWAIPAIESMTRYGIIKGYSDQTFRPANDIKKIEMLLLMARAAEFQNDDYAPYVSFANDLYAPVMSNYDLGDTYNKYKPEVSFLLYKGIISIGELDSLIGGGQANMAVKRYEAAVLLTKLMGAEAQVSSNIAPVLSYSDFARIPASARAYVEYVTTQGIMGGVGDNNFGPSDNVTRAQVAVILERVLEKLNYSVRVGTVQDVDPDAGTITLYNRDADADMVIPVDFETARIVLDSYPATIYSIAKGAYALILYSGNTVVSVEALSSVNDMAIVNGRIVSLIEDDGGDFSTLTVQDSIDGGLREFVIYHDELPQIFRDGSAADLSALTSGQTVTVTLANNEAVSISINSFNFAISGTGNAGGTDSTSVSGVITNIELTPDYVISVLLSDDSLTDYIVSGSVVVNRNGRKASLRDLLVGDSVTIAETDGVISAITATSTESETVGVLSSIFISSSPRLGVISSGEENEYPVAANAEYEVDGGEATIYDLRLGANVELGLEGSSIVRVVSSSEASTHRTDGVIIDFNLGYGYMLVENDDVTEQVFLAMNGTDVSTSIIDGVTGDRINASDLESGLHVLAVGTYSNGSFIATTVVILPE